mmetsp:Transcript_31793/g.78851  ORF Transcript_31793/g.78851 Transcript_31793/m.78851 type:complete len:163 (-) Transcript_31793:206-694(-)
MVSSLTWTSDTPPVGYPKTFLCAQQPYPPPADAEYIAAVNELMEAKVLPLQKMFEGMPPQSVNAKKVEIGRHLFIGPPLTGFVGDVQFRDYFTQLLNRTSAPPEQLSRRLEVLEEVALKDENKPKDCSYTPFLGKANDCILFCQPGAQGVKSMRIIRAASTS